MLETTNQKILVIEHSGKLPIYRWFTYEKWWFTY